MEFLKESGFPNDIHKVIPPPDAWIWNEGGQLVFGANIRSVFGYVFMAFLIPPTLIFIGAIYGTQIWKGEFSLKLSLIGLLVIAALALFWCVALLLVFGKIEITLNKDGGEVFTGYKTIGITERFQWQQIRRLELVHKTYQYPKRGGHVLLAGRKNIAFGGLLTEQQMDFMFQTCKKVFESVKVGDVHNKGFD
jgi:hypothetical protein